MMTDRRLSLALHALQHLHGRKTPVTSEELGSLLKAHPVVLRRTFAGLRESGILRAAKGHRGGWSLGRSLDRISLREVYDAAGITPRFSLRRVGPPARCVLERAADRTLENASSEAEAHLRMRLQATMVSGLLEVARARKEGRDGGCHRRRGELCRPLGGDVPRPSSKEVARRG